MENIKNLIIDMLEPSPKRRSSLIQIFHRINDLKTNKGFFEGIEHPSIADFDKYYDIAK